MDEPTIEELSLDVATPEIEVVVLEPTIESVPPLPVLELAEEQPIHTVLETTEDQARDFEASIQT